MERLSEDRCWELLAATGIGRLALSVAGKPEIYPLNDATANRTIVFRTSPGTKLIELTINAEVAFEIDGWDDSTAWSVLARGRAVQLQHSAGIDAAEQLRLQPWDASPKHEYVVITPSQVTGRVFRRDGVDVDLELDAFDLR